MIRFALPALAALALAACNASVPDSGAGVGFGNYSEYQRAQAAREAALQGSALPPPSAISTEPLAASGAQTDANGVVQASPSNPAPAIRDGAISAENDFTAVSGRRSIEDDAALRAQNQQQYQVIQPTALPSRRGNSSPNIVQFALQAKNARGQTVYRRIAFNAEARFRRNCAKYLSPDHAQQAFLQNGGPSKDRQGLDPDGDGFACAWDPAPFRSAVQSNAGS